jgi:hypothetical protein
MKIEEKLKEGEGKGKIKQNEGEKKEKCMGKRKVKGM